VQNGKSIIRILPHEVGIATKSISAIPLPTYTPPRYQSKAFISSHSHAIHSNTPHPIPSRINKVLLPTIRLPLLTIIFRILRRASLAFTISRSRIELREDLGWDTVEEFLRVDTQ
jgi:hypothetical protein